MDDEMTRLLGGLLWDNDRIPDAVAAIRPEHFRVAADRLVFAAIAAAYATGPVDLVAAFIHLQDAGQIAEVGGPARLAELWERAREDNEWPTLLQRIATRSG